LKNPGTIRQHAKALLLSGLKRLWRDQQGGYLVETAISFVLLCTLIFGVIEGAWAVYSYHFLANAAHDGTRYAIVRGGGWGTHCSGYGASGCFVNPTDVQNYVASRNFPGVNITPGEVCVQFLGATPGSTPTSCTTSTSVANNRPGDIVQVTISYPFTFGIPGVPHYTANLTSTSQMTISQ